MKKIIVIILCFSVMNIGLYAQEETNNPDYKIHLGLAFSSIQTSNDFMGALEFGINLFYNPNTDFGIRNFVIFDIGTITIDNDMNFLLALSDKIIFGTISRNGLFFPYFGVQMGVGIFNNENKVLFELPIIINSGPVVGLDIYVQKKLSVFFEYVILANFVDGNIFYAPKFTMGKRYLF